MTVSDTAQIGTKVARAEEEQQSSTFREKISTNWQNRKVMILSSAVLTVAGGVGVGLAIAFSGGTAAIAIAAVAAGVGLLGTVGGVFIPSRSSPIEPSRAENITPQVTEPISGQGHVDEREEVESTHDELDAEDPEKAKHEKAAKAHKDADHATHTAPLARDEVSLDRDEHDLPPLSDPETARTHDLPPYIRAQQHGRTDLSPSTAPRTPSIVDKYFKALTGKDFDPIKTQNNSYRAYRILEDVANGNKESLIPSLQRFAAKWPKSFGPLLNAAIGLAREAGHTDLIPLIEAQRTAPQSLVAPSSPHVAPSLPVTSSESEPQAFEIEDPKTSSSSWGKYLGFGMLAAAAAGAAYAYAYGINPLTYFQGTPVVPDPITDPITPEQPVTPDTETVDNNGTCPAPQFTFPEHRPEVVVTPKTASTLFDSSPVLDEFCPAPGYNASSTPSGATFFTPIREEVPVRIEEVVSPVNVEPPQTETQVPKFSVPPEVVTDTRTCAAPEITVDNPFASTFADDTCPAPHTSGSTTPQGVVTPGIDYRPPEAFFGAGKISEEHTDLVLPQGTKPSSFSPVPLAQKEFTCVAPPTSSGMDFGAFSQRQSPAFPVSLPLVPADPTTSGVCAATTPIFTQSPKLPVTPRLDTNQVALPTSQNVPFSPSPPVVSQPGEVSISSPALETAPATTPVVPSDASAVVVYGQKTPGTPVDVNPVYTKEQLDFILRSGRQMPTATSQSGAPFIFEHSGTPTNSVVVPFEAPQESTSKTTIAAAPTYEEFCHPTSNNGTVPANFNYEARDAFCDICSPTTPEGIASPEFLSQRDAACEQAFHDHRIFIKGPVFTQDQARGTDVVVSGSPMPHTQGMPQIEGPTTQIPTFDQKFYDFFMGRRNTFGSGQFAPTVDAKPPVITNGKGQFLIAPSTDPAPRTPILEVTPTTVVSTQAPATTPPVIPGDVTPLPNSFKPVITQTPAETTPAVTPQVTPVDVTPLPTPFKPTPAVMTPAVTPKVVTTPAPTPFGPGITQTPAATTPAVTPQVTPVDVIPVSTPDLPLAPKSETAPLPLPFSPEMSPPPRAVTPLTQPVPKGPVTPLPMQFSPIPHSGTDIFPVEQPVQDGVCIASARNAHTRFFGQFPTPVIGNHSTIAAPQVEYPQQARLEAPKMDTTPVVRPYEEFCGSVSVHGVLPADVDPAKVDAFCHVCGPTTEEGLVSGQFLSQRDAACEQTFNDHRIFLRNPIFTQDQATGSEVVVSGSTMPHTQEVPQIEGSTTQIPNFGKEDYIDILFGRRNTFGSGQFVPTVDTKPPVITNDRGQFLIAPSTDSASTIPSLESIEPAPTSVVTTQPTPGPIFKPVITQTPAATTPVVTPQVTPVDVTPLPTPFKPVITQTPAVMTPAVTPQVTPRVDGTPVPTPFKPVITQTPAATVPAVTPEVTPRPEVKTPVQTEAAPTGVTPMPPQLNPFVMPQPVVRTNTSELERRDISLEGKGGLFGETSPVANISQETPVLPPLRPEQCSLIPPANVTSSAPVTKEEEVVIPSAPEDPTDTREVEAEEVELPKTPKAPSISAQRLDPSQEASPVSRDCIKLGNTMSEQFRGPYNTFFHGKSKDAWEDSDSYTYRFWNTKDKCYLPPEASTVEGARERKGPMVDFCNCMMDLWKTRNPSVAPPLQVTQDVVDPGKKKA